MRRRVTIVVAIGSLIVAALWLKLRNREASVPRAQLAYMQTSASAEFAHRPRENRVMAAIQQPPVAEPAASDGQKAAAEPTEFERAIGPPRWHPRPAGEWQGMLVNLNVTPPCDGPDLCGMARACRNGRCGPCEFDAECGSGESCVLDHCVRSASVSCRRSADCGAGSVCVLSGYSSGVRGNEGMRAYCLAIESGASQLPPAPESPPTKDTRSHLPDDDLLKAANSARQQ